MAFVLINTELASENEVLENLKAMPEVREAHVAYGEYDVIVCVEAGTMESLKGIFTSKIMVLDKVRSSLTMIVV